MVKVVAREKLAVGAEGAGLIIPCPKCSSQVTIPRKSSLPPKVGDPWRRQWREFD